MARRVWGYSFLPNGINSDPRGRGVAEAIKDCRFDKTSAVKGHRRGGEQGEKVSISEGGERLEDTEGDPGDRVSRQGECHSSSTKDFSSKELQLADE